MRKNYSAIREASGRFATDVEEKDDAKREEAMLCRKPDKLETAIMATLWDTVLSQNPQTTCYKKCDINLDTAQHPLESLNQISCRKRKII